MFFQTGFGRCLMTLAQPLNQCLVKYRAVARAGDMQWWGQACPCPLCPSTWLRAWHTVGTHTHLQQTRAKCKKERTG